MKNCYFKTATGSGVENQSSNDGKPDSAAHKSGCRQDHRAEIGILKAKFTPTFKRLRAFFSKTQSGTQHSNRWRYNYNSKSISANQKSEKSYYWFQVAANSNSSQ